MAAALWITGCAAESGPASQSEELRETRAATAKPGTTKTGTDMVTTDPEMPKEPTDGEKEVAPGDAHHAAPSFDVIAPILRVTCGNCHRPTKFDSLEKVQLIRSEMLRKITAGEMPQNNAAWRDTLDGQLVLEFLRSTPDSEGAF